MQYERCGTRSFVMSCSLSSTILLPFQLVSYTIRCFCCCSFRSSIKNEDEEHSMHCFSHLITKKNKFDRLWLSWRNKNRKFYATVIHLWQFLMFSMRISDVNGEKTK